MMGYPISKDLKRFVRVSSYTIGTRLYITSFGDDIAGETRGDGAGMYASRDTAGESSTEIQFLDWYEIGGGGVMWDGAENGDWVTFEIVAPATTVTPNGSGTGNCNVVSGVVVPAEGDGDYDIDLSEGSSDPVPLIQSGGYWNWSYPDTGLGQVTAAPAADGDCNLVAAPLTLTRYMNRRYLFGDSRLENCVYWGVDPSKMLPHWKAKITVHNEGGSHTVKVWGKLVGARVKNCD